jgi:hypothetical protein
MNVVLVRFIAGLLTCGLLCWSSLALAQGSSIAELSQRLRTGADFRVRTQAALALGASASPDAIRPLCAALSDSNTTVRAASAAALGRLSLGGTECLTRRLGEESSDEVKSVIQRALARLAPAKVIGPDTKYYVAIGEVTNKTPRSTAALDRKVRAVLERQLGGLPGFVIAPKNETEAEAKRLLGKFKRAKGIFVWPKVVVAYAGGQLRLDLELSLFSYPNKDFKGSMSRNLTMSDAAPGDTASEDEMIQVAAERLVPDLAKNAERI